MKSNFLNLTMVNIKAAVDMRSLKQNKKKTIPLLTYLVIIYLVMLGFSAGYTVLFDNLLKDSGVYIATTIYFAAICGFLNLSTGIMSMKNVYAGKDYDMLKSMPIKKRDIVASKIVSLYLVEVLYAFAFLFPNGVVNSIFSGNIIYLLYAVVMIFLVPALPIFLATIVTFLLSAVADRFRFGNIISIILYLGLFAVIFITSYSIGRSKEGALNVSGLMWTNPSLYFVNEAVYGETYNFLYFVLINIALIIVVVLVLILSYDYIHTLINSFRSSVKYERKMLKNKSEFKALFSSELKKITKSKTLFINSIVSGVMSIAVAGILSYTLSSIESDNVKTLIYDYGYVAALVIMFTAGTSVPGSFLISAEGKYFWMIKTYPIDYKKFLKAKLLTSIIFTLPFAVIAAIVISIFIKTTIINIVFLFIMTIIYSLFTNVLALRFNLAFPKLKWMNENEIAKQSASVLLSTLTDMGVVLGLSGLLVGLSFINSILAVVLTVVALVIPTVILYLALMKKGERIIESYENF